MVILNELNLVVLAWLYWRYFQSPVKMTNFGQTKMTKMIKPCGHWAAHAGPSTTQTIKNKGRMRPGADQWPLLRCQWPGHRSKADLIKQAIAHEQSRDNRAGNYKRDEKQHV